MNICQYAKKSDIKWAFLVLPVMLCVTTAFAQQAPVKSQDYTDEQIQTMIGKLQINFDGYVKLLKANKAKIPQNQAGLISIWEELQARTASAFDVLNNFNKGLPSVDDSAAREKAIDARLVGFKDQMRLITISLGNLITEANTIQNSFSFNFASNAQKDALKQMLNGRTNPDGTKELGAIQIQSSVAVQMMTVQALINGNLIPSKPMPNPDEPPVVDEPSNDPPSPFAPPDEPMPVDKPPASPASAEDLFNWFKNIIHKATAPTNPATPVRPNPAVTTPSQPSPSAPPPRPSVYPPKIKPEHIPDKKPSMPKIKSEDIPSRGAQLTPTIEPIR